MPKESRYARGWIDLEARGREWDAAKHEEMMHQNQSMMFQHPAMVPQPQQPTHYPCLGMPMLQLPNSMPYQQQGTSFSEYPDTVCYQQQPMHMIETQVLTGYAQHPVANGMPQYAHSQAQAPQAQYMQSASMHPVMVANYHQQPVHFRPLWHPLPQPQAQPGHVYQPREKKKRVSAKARREREAAEQKATEQQAENDALATKAALGAAQPQEIRACTDDTQFNSGAGIPAVPQDALINPVDQPFQHNQEEGPGILSFAPQDEASFTIGFEKQLLNEGAYVYSIPQQEEVHFCEDLPQQPCEDADNFDHPRQGLLSPRRTCSQDGFEGTNAYTQPEGPEQSIEVMDSGNTNEVALNDDFSQQPVHGNASLPTPPQDDKTAVNYFEYGVTPPDIAEFLQMPSTIDFLTPPCHTEAEVTTSECEVKYHDADEFLAPLSHAETEVTTGEREARYINSNAYLSAGTRIHGKPVPEDRSDEDWLKLFESSGIVSSDAATGSSSPLDRDVNITSPQSTSFTSVDGFSSSPVRISTPARANVPASVVGSVCRSKKTTKDIAQLARARYMNFSE